MKEKILAVGDRVWGKGDTIDEALKNMRANGPSKKYSLYRCHPDTRVDEDGRIVNPVGFRPKKI